MGEGSRPPFAVTATTRQSGSVQRWADTTIFIVLIAGTVVVPLLFWPWATDVFVGPKFAALRLSTAGAAVAAGVWLVVGRPALRLRLSDWAAFVFLLLNVLAYARSVDRQTSLLGEPLQHAGLVTVFAVVGVYAIARVSIRTPRRFTALLTAASSAATIAAIYGAVQIAGADPFWSALPKGRVFSSIGQPNWFAAYLVLTVPVTIALTAATTHRALRRLGIGATLLQVVVLVATLSRSGYVGLAAALVVGGLLAARGGMQAPRNPKRFVAATVAVIFVGVLLVVGLSRTTSALSPGKLAGRAASTVDLGGFDSRRYFALWEVGLAIAADHAITGAGQDTYAIVFPEYRDSVLDPAYAEYFARFRPESPHNVYVSIAAGAGFPALATYLVLVGAALTLILPRDGQDGRESILLAGLGVALAGHLVTDCFVTTDLSGSWLFWALMGAGLAAIDRNTQHGIDPDLRR